MSEEGVGSEGMSFLEVEDRWDLDPRKLLSGALFSLGLLCAACNPLASDDPLTRACGTYPFLKAVYETANENERRYERVLFVWNRDSWSEQEMLVAAGGAFFGFFERGAPIHEEIREGNRGPFLLVRQFSDSLWTHELELALNAPDRCGL